MKSPGERIIWRAAMLLLFGLLLLLRFERAGRLTAAAQTTWLAAAQSARAFGGDVVRDYPASVDAASRRRMESALAQFNAASRQQWLTVSRRTSMTSAQITASLDAADQDQEKAAQDIAAAVRGLPGFLELPTSAVIENVLQLRIPFGRGMVLIGHGSPQAVPQFSWGEIDLSSGTDHRLSLADAPGGILGVKLLNPPAGNSGHRVTVLSGGRVLGTIKLAVTVPDRFHVAIRIYDETGKSTPAAFGLYSSAGELLVPDGALDFSAGGYRYEATHFREHSNAGYWPGRDAFSRSSVVRGDFSMELPAGAYRLIASKGPEYRPIDKQVTVAPAMSEPVAVHLQRWIDMASHGWHSGDCHIHYERRDSSANERVLLWMRAEDVRVGNILRMGDGRQTYFEQYAFGRNGQALQLPFVMIPGQEDPRTNVLGHTISLNLQRPVRDNRESYYLYSNTFDEARRQGGLSGYAHVNSDSFLVHRDLTVNVPRGKVDFAEICEFGEINTDLYYEFLNLGFQLPAAAGSDVPWGGTIGESRVYAFTGGPLDPRAWFEAVRRGRTFVTSGPMLELTIDGRHPGDVIEKARRAMRVSARSMVGFSAHPPGRLEVVSNGEVLRSTEITGKLASLDFELPAQESMWIAARVKSDKRVSAHTSPIYVVVNGARHWNRAKAPALIEKRLRVLAELERVVDQHPPAIGPGSPAQWESADAWIHSRNGLRRMIGEARKIYQEMRRELP